MVYSGGSLSDRSGKSLLLAKTWSVINMSVCNDLLLRIFSSFSEVCCDLCPAPHG